jgi:hypothetical protein
MAGGKTSSVYTALPLKARGILVARSGSVRFADSCQLLFRVSGSSLGLLQVY